MSKNIAIQEGGTAKSMTVHKLKTTLVAGGTCLWVPEDEVSLGTKHITENGTYTALEDGKYGYSQVTVNVPGGAGSASSSGTPTTSGGTTPGGTGSAVVGTDPTDGNEYGVGVDENGNLVTTKIPSSISVGKAPDKTDYIDGETIDYSGIIVTLKGGDGEPFANSDYPNGRVPFSELIFPVETADASSTQHETKKQSSDFGQGPWPQPVNAVQGELTANEGFKIVFDGYIALLLNNNAYGMSYLCVSDKPNQQAYCDFGTGTAPRYFPLNGVYIHNGKTAYYGISVSGLTFSNISGGANYYTSTVGDGFSIEQAAWTLLYGEAVQIGGEQIVPVQWESPYDGRTFETTLGINVSVSGNENSGSGNGGGGGHSF